MKITAKDIAREAGVSEATVSIILNNKAGHYRISEKTRQKVLEIAERYEFTCNPIAENTYDRPYSAKPSEPFSGQYIYGD